jgi:DNA-binding transcriptional ArsR family regulator
MRGVVELEELDSHFGALSHRTRRAVLHVLHANGGTMTSGAIAQRFDCTWQTTSRHLRILEEAGLIRASLRGRERIYELDSTRLTTVTTVFIERFRASSPRSANPARRATQRG